MERRESIVIAVAPPAATITDVTRRFRGANDVVTAVDGVTASIASAALTVVAGPSGSGKSTLLSLLACTQRADQGTISIGDTEVGVLSRRARRELRRDRLGIVLPQPSENLLDRLDAAANIRWAAARRRRAPAVVVDPDELLDAVGLAGAQHRAVRELSGGEQQRLAIACALAGTPELVILDEPTASLDRHSAERVVDVLAAVAASGTTMIAASHDPMLLEAAHDLITLEHGRRVG